jgi:Scramblase/Protein of unknown function (DUF2510)
MSSPAAAWHPDPMGRHQLRYWDGQAWTEHVSTNGSQTVDPLQPTTPGQVQATATEADGITTIERLTSFDSAHDPSKIQQQVHGNDGIRSAGVGEVAFEGDGTLFHEPILVVNQKAKVFEITNQYSVFDRQGRQIAAVNEVGQSGAKKAMRLLTNLDQFMTHKLEVVNGAGEVQLRITRPAKVMKSTVIVANAQDQEIGRIVQDNVFGKIHFTLQAGGHTYGAIKAENWRAWNFRIEDHAGTEVARITKTFEGFAKAMFTTADNYVVQIHTQLTQPLNALVVAAALCVDTALKQDSN